MSANESTPLWGDNPEFRAYCAARHAHDPHYTTLPELIRPELEVAQLSGPEKYTEYLNALSGIGTFAVKGTVFIPKSTKVFGDIMLLPNDYSPDIDGVEQVETQDDFPYTKGKLAYTIRRARIQTGGDVAIVAEEFVEDGKPRILYPSSLERFDLYHVSVPNDIERRNRRNLSGVLRALGLPPQQSAE